MIWSMVLAAGLSKRMGEQKLLLPFGDKSIIETVIETAVRSKTDRTLVVLGFDRERIEKLIDPTSVKTVYNPDYEKGMLSSVQCGVGALPDDAAAALIMLGDQPAATVDTINKIIGAYHASHKGIVLPVFENRRGHPVLIGLKYKEEIAGLDPDIGLRQLIRNHQDDIEEVPADSPAVHQDIDNPDDYRIAVKKINPPD